MKCPFYSPKVFYLITLFLFLFSGASAQYDAALRLTTIATSPVKYGTSVPFNVTIFNQSSTQAITNVKVVIYLGPALTYDNTINAIWTPEGSIANAYVTTISTQIDPLASTLITMNVKPQPFYNNVNAWNVAAEIYEMEDISGNIVNNLDLDSVHDKNPNNDGGGALGTASDDAINGNGTGAPGSTSAATDEDDHDVAKVRIYDVALKKLLKTTGPVQYLDTIEFISVVYNQGNETTGQVIIQELITEGYVWDLPLNTPLGWTGAAPKPKYAFTNLLPNDSIVIPVKLILSSESFDGEAWNNYTEVFSVRDLGNVNVGPNEADSDVNSNSLYENQVLPGSAFDNVINGQGISQNEDEDDHDVAAPRVFDLAIKKERSTAVPSYSYTQNVTYTVTLYNQGNVTANTITITDTLPCGLEFLPGLNPGWALSGPNKVSFTYTTPLLPATSHTLQLIFGVNPCYVDPTNAWTNYIEISSATAADGGPALDIDGTFDNILANDYQYSNLNNNNEIDALGPITNSDEDNHDVELIQVVDFALKKLLVTPPPYAYGENITFITRIYNQGNVVSDLVRVKDIVPAGYHFNPALNPGWNPADTTYSITSRMFPEDTFDIPIILSVLQSDGRRDWFNYTSIVLVQDTVGNFRFDDADSFISTGNPAEFSIEPGDPADNNIFVLGPPNVGLDEDDHDPAGFRVFDLALTKTLLNPQPSYDYGSTASFSIVVTNEGGTTAGQIQVTDYLPCGFTFSAANNPGWTLVGGNPVFTSNSILQPGQSLNLTINLTVQFCANANAHRNVAEISLSRDSLNTGINDFDSTPDNNPNNDIPDEDDIDDASLDVYDLALVKNTVNPQPSYSLGSQVTFRISVTNEGNLTANNVTITDYMPCGYTFTNVGNPGWTLVGGDPQYNITSLTPGQTINIDITLTIVACSTANAYLNAAEINNGNTDSGQPGNDADSTPDFNETNDPDAEDDHDTEVITVILTGALGGNVWEDVDRDGVYDNGEPFFNNATVQLYDCSNNLIATDFTDANGLFEFLNLQAGGYTVRVISSTLPANTDFTLQNIGGDDTIDSDVNATGFTACITLDAGEVDYTNDAGYVTELLGALGGNVWNDQDGDGLYDGGEPFTSGVTVELYDCANRLIGTDVTDGAGLFEFLNLQAGGYAVRVVTSTLPANTSYTIQNAGVNDNIDSDVNPATGFTACITLDAGETDYTNDAGYLLSTNIGDFVWNDANGNGIQDGGESGISGVQVRLYTGAGGLVATTSTNGSGIYQFNNVNAGNYYVVFTAPADYSFIDANVGANDNVDSDVTGANGNGSTSIFTVIGGINNLTIDAGLFLCAKIGEQVWYDTDKDDIWDPNENGINGLKVELYRRVNNNWVLYDYEFTGHKPNTPSDDGFFQFCAAPGTYYIRVVMPPLGLVQAKANVFGVRSLTASNEQKNDSDLTNNFGKGTTESFTVTSGQYLDNIGAGFYPMATAGNLVWEDSNINGIQDIGEQPVANVLVEAYNVNNQMVGQAYTNSAGVYKIEYLEKQDYYLKFNPPAGYGMTISNASINDDSDSDVDHSNGLNTTKKYSMQPSVDFINIDAGVAFGALPVKYNYIKGSWHNDHNLLEWETALEINADEFIVQRLDKKSNLFVEIGTVKAKGNSTKDYAYSFKDFDLSYDGYYEYRLLQKDLDGRSELSEVVLVLVRKESLATSKIYPNPIKEKFFIELPKTTSPLTYSMITADGKVLSKTSLASVTEVIEVNVANLPRGSYQLLVEYDNKKEIHKLIILE